MVVVGSGLQNGYHRSAVGVSVCGVRVSGDDAQFGDGIGRRIVSNEVILRLIIIRAFDRVIVCLFAVAVDRHYSVVVSVALNGIVSAQPGRVGIDCAGLIEC